MKMYAMAAAMVLGALDGAQAQQAEIKWAQTVNVPKGQNMPRDRADILGIELGDTYEEAKKKLEQLASEGIQPKPPRGNAADRMAAKLDGQRSGPPPMREERRIYNLKAPGANSTISASFVQKIELQRELPTANGKMSDSLSVQFSAPSSGHQVLGISRSVTYHNQNDQPLISDTIEQLKQKMKFAPVAVAYGNPKFRFQFDSGKPFLEGKPALESCLPRPDVNAPTAIKTINETGLCDAVLELGAQTGVSRNHASILLFTLADNDRAKANLTADYAFLSGYAERQQQETRGAPPKL